MTMVLYNLQHKENQPFIVNLDEFIQVIEDHDPTLYGFFNVLF